MTWPKSQRGGDRRSGKKYGPNRVRYCRVCERCRMVFNSARPDAMYCRQACKSAAARKRRDPLTLPRISTTNAAPPLHVVRDEFQCATRASRYKPAAKKPAAKKPAAKKPAAKKPAAKKPAAKKPAARKIKFAKKV